MTEQTPEPQGEGTVEPQGETPEKDTKPQGEEPSKPKGDDTDWQAAARKWEKAAKKDAKEKADAEAQLKAIQDMLSGKDQQATEAEKRAAAAELEATKYRIAYKAGLPPDLAERLRGSTVEELETDAEALAKYAKGKKPRSDAGADDGGGTRKKDPNALLREWAGG